MLLDNCDPGSLDCVVLILRQTPGVRSVLHTFSLYFSTLQLPLQRRYHCLHYAYSFDIHLCHDVCLKHFTLLLLYSSRP